MGTSMTCELVLQLSTRTFLFLVDRIIMRSTIFWLSACSEIALQLEQGEWR